VFFAQDEALEGVKAVGAAGIDARTIWKVEARDILIRNRDQVARGGSIIVDFRKGVTNLNDNVVVAQGPKLLKGERLLFDLRTGTSRLEGPEFWRVY
jgi:lipopolysaccharide export system protein LptA